MCFATSYRFVYQFCAIKELSRLEHGGSVNIIHSPAASMRQGPAGKMAAGEKMTQMDNPPAANEQGRWIFCVCFVFVCYKRQSAGNNYRWKDTRGERRVQEVAILFTERPRSFPCKLPPAAAKKTHTMSALQTAFLQICDFKLTQQQCP